MSDDAAAAATSATRPTTPAASPPQASPVADAPTAAPRNPSNTIADTGSLASAFGEALLRLHDGRLRDLRWFRTEWQRSGAATGRAIWIDDDGRGRDVVVKVPVNLREYRWLRRVADRPLGGPDRDEHLDHPTVRLVRSGDAIDPYDVAWVLLEKLPHGPLGSTWHPSHLARITAAAAKFHALAAATPLDGAPIEEPWEDLVKSAREKIRDPAFPERSRWSSALKDVSKKLDGIVERWRLRRPLAWIHGDLHPANAMSRVAVDEGPVALIDFAEVRVGSWVEDAIYLERLHWPRPERLEPKPLRLLADARKALGLENGDYPAVAAWRRFLLAATAPAFRSEASPVFLAACLARLEDLLRDPHCR
jgi:hypothetical protein